jgi:hypothetical protein
MAAEILLRAVPRLSKFCERKRLSCDSTLARPGEPERPFRTDETEPAWLAAELRPAPLPCERAG